ncbi:hypothetical protein [Pseudomonas sp. TE3610]
MKSENRYSLNEQPTETFDTETIRQLPANSPAYFSLFWALPSGSVAIEDFGETYTPAVSGKAMSVGHNSAVSLILDDQSHFRPQRAFALPGTVGTYAFLSPSGVVEEEASFDGGTLGTIINVDIPVWFNPKVLRWQVEANGAVLLDNVGISPNPDQPPTETFESEIPRELPSYSPAIFSHFWLLPIGSAAIEDFGERYSPLISGKAIVIRNNASATFTWNDEVTGGQPSAYALPGTRGTFACLNRSGDVVYETPYDGGLEGVRIDIEYPVNIEVKALRFTVDGAGSVLLDNVVTYLGKNAPI